MKLTKQDYMRLPKERLAELLAEMQDVKIDIPSIPTMPTKPSVWGCDGIHCTNPQMDCINCPRRTSGGVYTAPNTATGISTLKDTIKGVNGVHWPSGNQIIDVSPKSD